MRLERNGTATQPWFDRFLKLPTDGSKIWNAPWSVKVMIQVMLLWFCAFCVMVTRCSPMRLVCSVSIH